MIRSKAEAQDILSDLAAVESQLAVCQCEMNEDLRLARLKHESLIANLSKQATDKHQQLAAWAKENRELFCDKQSLDFPHGSLVYHKGNRYVGLMDGWTWKTALQKMRSLRKIFRSCIRRKEEIDKQEILDATREETQRLSEADLKRIGLRICRDEAFSVQVKAERPAR